MNPQEIMDAIKQAQAEITKKNEELKSFGIKKEYAERTYRVELRKNYCS